MDVETIMLGELAANCHIIPCGDVCAAVDVGAEPQKLLRYLEKNELHLSAILLTHGHYDHVGGVELVRQTTGAKVYIHEADGIMLQDGRANLSWQISSNPYTPVSEFETIQDGDTITVGNRLFQVLHTPGHTPGGVCFITENLLFSGDTLFKGSVGRTDLSGDPAQLRSSLDRISALTEDYLVYPGHFENTTLAREKRTNPYIRRN